MKWRRVIGVLEFVFCFDMPHFLRGCGWRDKNILARLAAQFLAMLDGVGNDERQSI
jgi:hypothetical protein